MTYFKGRLIGWWLFMIFVLVAQAGVRPHNDDFANRAPITGSWVTVSGNNRYATREAEEPTQGDKSLWWSWMAPTSGVYTVTAFGQPGQFSAWLGVYTGSALTNLGLVADYSPVGGELAYTDRVAFHAVAGTAYAIAVSTISGQGGGLSLSVVPTAPPTVTITSPTNNPTFYVGDSLTLSADASDSDGMVSNVEFYLDDALVWAFTNEPYVCSVTVGPWNHRLRVQATDNLGVTTISSEVQFLGRYPPPSNDDFDHRAQITGSWVSVTDNNLLASREPGEPTQGDKSLWWSWMAPTSGVYTVTAFGQLGQFSAWLGVYTGSALTNLGLVDDYSPVGGELAYTDRVVVHATAGTAYAIAVSTVSGIGGGLSLSVVPTAPPTVTITSPPNNPTFYVGDSVTLSADASDSDGLVTNVEFYMDYALVGTVTNRPYVLSLSVTNAPLSYRLWVKATDNCGVTTVSSEVQFLVTYPPPANDDFADRIPITGSWVTVSGDNRYGTREPGEPTQGDKSAWWSWTAPTSGVYTVTAVGLPGLFWPALDVYTGSVLTKLSFLTNAICSGLDPTYSARVVIEATAGTAYVLAVGTVGGQGGGLSLSVVPTAPPTVTITSPTNNPTFYVGDPVILSADATDSDGTVTNVEFYVDYAIVGTATNSPYVCTVSFPSGPEGHRLQVRATDNWGLTTVSSEVQFLITYPPPGNDNFAGSIPITGSWVLASGDNSYATRELEEQTHGDRSVWWSWTAPTSGVYTVTAFDWSGRFTPSLDVFTGSALSGLTLVASATYNNSDDTRSARAEIEASAGTAYVMAVSTLSFFGGGFSLSITTPALTGTPAKLDGLTKVEDGEWRVILRTGASSVWGVEISTNLTSWEGPYGRFLPNGLYEFHDRTGRPLSRRFYRLIAEP